MYDLVTNFFKVCFFELIVAEVLNFSFVNYDHGRVLSIVRLSKATFGVNSSVQADSFDIFGLETLSCLAVHLTVRFASAYFCCDNLEKSILLLLLY